MGVRAELSDRERVARYLPGWRVAANHFHDENETHVTVWQFPQGGTYTERAVWISACGTVVWDVVVDERGYVRCPDGLRVECHVP